MATNPFETLGMEAKMAISEAQLETNFLRLSRELHPDLNQDGDQSEVLARSAALNDAHRILTDPWRRARALIDIRDPQLFTMSKKLAPTFLMTAIELAEEVDSVCPERVSQLEATCRSKLDEYLGEITKSLDAEDFAKAAVQLHESRYYRKALADLSGAA